MKTLASLNAPVQQLRVAPRAGSHDELSCALYDSGAPAAASSLPPLVLVHSVNATASAFEMEPVFVRQSRRRRVLALDLPGFGASDKPDIAYTPLLMRDAIVALLDHLGDGPVDMMALSLSSEFATEAALHRPGRVRSLALISPTGMELKRVLERHEAGRTRESRPLRRLLRGTRAGLALYRLLTSRASMRWYLSRSWGAPDFDPRLLEHGRALAQLPGAQHAPLDFVSGALFTRGAIERYRLLPLPLWVSHGRDGPFSDVGACPARSGNPVTGESHRVRRSAFDTGAMPHFSQPQLFDQAYDAFLAEVERGGGESISRQPRTRSTPHSHVQMSYSGR